MSYSVWVLPLALASYAALWAADNFVLPRGPTEASLKSLSFIDGQFRQEFYISGGGVLKMEWGAKIKRGSQFLCSGGGETAYKDQDPEFYEPDDWTFDDCPELQSGDIAVAVWEYQDANGVLRSIGGTITLTEEHLR